LSTIKLINTTLTDIFYICVTISPVEWFEVSRYDTVVVRNLRNSFYYTCYRMSNKLTCIAPVLLNVMFRTRCAIYRYNLLKWLSFTPVARL